ncbi:GNAT family N-acetyltransferase [Curtobacterium sp. MCBD17_035]|uniref:GNAT family N-acetyltransferase n=1 Tax=Curtobacterium sp. MCBD17_035 TaxID=2175673 RepID=UPI000DA96B1C|nr:GNAT family N-acetyltransferase [Curtobacterium sp. MCBD17_035]WIB68041.1 GNAT family N-acetyltransferase [Curtobacterium sp. MCBD17_035]
MSALDGIQVRPGTAIEADACVDLWLAALTDRDGEDQGAPVRERARSKFALPGAELLVATRTGDCGAGSEIVGFAVTSDRGDAVVGLELFATRPDARGLGVGRALLERVLAEAEASGAVLVELESRVTNARAIAVYEAAGFRPEGDPVPHPLGGDPVVRYALPVVGA